MNHELRFHLCSNHRSISFGFGDTRKRYTNRRSRRIDIVAFGWESKKTRFIPFADKQVKLCDPRQCVPYPSASAFKRGAILNVRLRVSCSACTEACLNLIFVLQLVAGEVDEQLQSRLGLFYLLPARQLCC